MTEIPRRTLPELAFIYSQDPNRRDVYVEGSFDSAIVTWFSSEYGLREVAVFPIAAIEIPDAELVKANRKKSNRDRIVYLAEFLSSNGAVRAAGVIDADFSHVRNENLVIPTLHVTDYSCMEMYFFRDACLSKFFHLCCRRDDWPVGDIMDSFSSVLQNFFLYRYANDELSWHMDWLDKNVCLSTNGWAIQLDEEAYLTRLLNKNGRARQRESFVECVTNLRKNLKSDPRYQMNGHDFIRLLSWYIRKKGISGARANVDSVLTGMTMALDHRSLGQELMFQSLSTRLG